MKKLLFCLMALATLTLVGCEKEEATTSALIGTWDKVKVEVNGESRPFEYSTTLKFTAKTVTIYDDQDYFNGVPIEYEYKDGKIWIMGTGLWEVISLNSSTLKLFIDEVTFTYRKR